MLLTGLAFRCCTLLGYHKIRQLDQSPLDPLSEQKVLCFWASWLTQCANQRKSLFSNSCWPTVAGCPFPTEHSGAIAARDACRVDNQGNFTFKGDITHPSCLVLVFGLWLVFPALCDSPSSRGVGGRRKTSFNESWNRALALTYGCQNYTR